MKRPSFRTRNHALLVAQIIEHMTGGYCVIEESNPRRFYVLRDIGGNWEIV